MVHVESSPIPWRGRNSRWCTPRPLPPVPPPRGRLDGHERLEPLDEGGGGVVCGSVDVLFDVFPILDAGKSTISGHILYATGMVDDRTLEKFEREATGPSPRRGMSGKGLGGKGRNWSSPKVLTLGAWAHSYVLSSWELEVVYSPTSQGSAP